MKKVAVAVLLIFCLVVMYNVLFCLPADRKTRQPRNYVEVSNQIQVQTAKELYEKFELRCCGFSGGAIDIIRNIGLMMTVYRPLTVEEARRLALDCQEIFLFNINSNKTIRPFLIEYPFPQSRVEFIFYVHDKHTGSFQKSNSVATFHTDVNGISYNIANPTTGRLGKYFGESYEEAKKIVLNERLKKQQPDNAVASSQTSPFAKKKSQTFFVLEDMCGGMDTLHHPKYTGPDEERAMGWALDKYAVQVAKSQGMKFHRVGDPTDNNLDYFLSFQTAQPMTLNVARVFATNILDDFWTMLKNSPEVKTYHEKSKITFKNYKSNSFGAEVASLKQVGLKIAYWDENVERLQSPYIAQVLFIGGTFQYFEADPQTQALRLVYQEPYDEALSFTKAQQKISN